MPKDKKVVGFQPGNKLGVGHGRPKLTAEQKALALTTRTQFKNLLSDYSSLRVSEIDKLIEDGDLPVIDIAVLRHLKQMAEMGSMERTDWTADHIMGAKPKVSKVEVSASQKIDLSKLSPAEIKQLQQIALSQENEDGE